LNVAARRKTAANLAILQMAALCRDAATSSQRHRRGIFAAQVSKSNPSSVRSGIVWNMSLLTELLIRLCAVLQLCRTCAAVECAKFESVHFHYDITEEALPTN